ncbi:MAG: hypothetical protein AAGA64_07375 [Bacteroidota bacterium]
MDHEGKEIGVVVLMLSLGADANRDGQIRFGDEPAIVDDPDLSDEVTKEKPFRFWINDDDDDPDSEYVGDDTPGQAIGDSTQIGFPKKVDGTRDLVDFFPVAINGLSSLVRAYPPESGYKHLLKHEDDALNFTYTNLTRWNVKDYLESSLEVGFGNGLFEAPQEAATHHITAAGYDITQDKVIIDALLDDVNPLGGVILVEGRTTTDKPLVYAVEDVTGNVLAESKLELSISSVEDMYRTINFRSAISDDGTVDNSQVVANTGQPSNLPDTTTDDRYFVFVHGYNVDEEAGRGWNAEVFKRLHQQGMTARFVGTQWYGDPPSALPAAKDFHKAGTQAFATSRLLGQHLNFTGGSPVVIAGHSMGNWVAGNAIAHEDLASNINLDKYFMINSALPIEAYDDSQVHDSGALTNRMVHNDWKLYPEELYASRWSELFEDSPNDERKNLKWGGFFSNPDLLSRTYNFYSTGEDVVEDAGSSESTEAALLQLVLSKFYIRGAGIHAWVGQEIGKGNPLLLFSWDQGGWLFNTSNEGVNIISKLDGPSSPNPVIMYTPAEVNNALASGALTNEHLAQLGFFQPFDYPDLYGPIVEGNVVIMGNTVTQEESSTLAGTQRVREELLSSAIPTRSYAAAANEINSLNPPNQKNRNFNMQKTNDQDGLMTGWPEDARVEDAKSGFTNGRWRHSDFKDIALPYVYKMYDKMIEEGNLKK